ncbi:hypothetical protein EV382_2368 [Micromonospora violae]|uniref:Lipoprotein n=2 Tax=Micromonospora violae TaxID=1278207 RepID=A0A4Q7UG50_9ACTN|nr:hypothetical protein EV382_2368 [Micromonospora violae]
MPRRLLSSIALGIAMILAGCGGPRTGEKIVPATRPAEDLSHRTPTSAPTESSYALGPAPADLRTVDWARVPLPGDFCGVPQLLRLGDSGIEAESRTMGVVSIGRSGEVEYGDIDGDKRPEAVVGLGCTNGGGTASGQLGFAMVVVGAVRGQLTTLGTITPQYTPDSQSHIPLLGEVEFKKGEVAVHESWYRPSDSTCCPSGKAVTVWSYDAGRLTPGAPRVVA